VSAALSEYFEGTDAAARRTIAALAGVDDAGPATPAASIAWVHESVAARLGLETGAAEQSPSGDEPTQRPSAGARRALVFTGGERLTGLLEVLREPRRGGFRLDVVSGDERPDLRLIQLQEGLFAEDTALVWIAGQGYVDPDGEVCLRMPWWTVRLRDLLSTVEAWPKGRVGLIIDCEHGAHHRQRFRRAGSFALTGENLAAAVVEFFVQPDTPSRKEGFLDARALVDFLRSRKADFSVQHGHSGLDFPLTGTDLQAGSLLRGEVWRIEGSRDRLGLVISSNVYNRTTVPVVNVAEVVVEEELRDAPLAIPISLGATEYVVMPDRMSAPMKRWFTNYVGTVDVDTMRKVSRALRIIEDL
jgi:mRNA interferase MazF